MNENNNTPKNPLELAQEAFLYGTEKLENSRKELQDFVIYVLDKQQELKVLDETFTKERTEILKIMKNNFELYQKVNFILETNFQKALQDYQTNFQKLIENSKLISLNLNDSDRKSLQDTTEQIKNQRKLRSYDFGIIALLAIVTILSGYFATQFYKTSIQTKIEARQEFLNQLERNNEIVVKKDDWNAFSNERKMIKSWSKSNPNDSKSYETFRNGIISTNPKLLLFENLMNDDLIGK